MKRGKVCKTNWYYTFWGLMTIAVVMGQLYVGLGYRIMAESMFEAIDRFEPVSYTHLRAHET